MVKKAELGIGKPSVIACDDLYACWDRLQKRGIEFMTPPPATYYDMLEERLPGWQTL